MEELTLFYEQFIENHTNRIENTLSYLKNTRHFSNNIEQAYRTFWRNDVGKNLLINFVIDCSALLLRLLLLLLAIDLLYSNLGFGSVVIRYSFYGYCVVTIIATVITLIRATLYLCSQNIKLKLWLAIDLFELMRFKRVNLLILFFTMLLLMFSQHILYAALVISTVLIRLTVKTIFKKKVIKKIISL